MKVSGIGSGLSAGVSQTKSGREIALESPTSSMAILFSLEIGVYSFDAYGPPSEVHLRRFASPASKHVSHRTRFMFLELLVQAPLVNPGLVHFGTPRA